jgi:Ca2+-binding RTX toxin-like protein
VILLVVAGAVPAWSDQGLYDPDGVVFPEAPSLFGRSVAVDGDIAVIGAPEHKTGTWNYSTGAVYVFARSGGTWALEQTLYGEQGQFGITVDVDGSTLAVGTLRNAAHVYTRTGGVWSEQQTISPPGVASGDYAGYAVALSGDTLALTAEGDDDGGSNAGAVYVYTRSGDVWSLQQKLLGDSAGDALGGHYSYLGYRIGTPLALDGDTLAVGTRNDDEGGSGAGAVHVFTRSSDVWAQEQKILGPLPTTRDFGFVVALEEDLLAVSSYHHPEYPDGRGAVWVYARTDSVWSEEAKLIGEEPHRVGAELFGDRFGVSLAFHGGLLAVGADLDEISGQASGAVHLYARSGGEWVQIEKLLGDSALSYFGRAVDFSGGALVVGEPRDDTTGTGGGAAHFFSFGGGDGPVFPSVPGVVLVDVAGGSQAIVHYDAPRAYDLEDGWLSPTCTPGPGAVFPSGTTTVSCTATDTDANTASATFDVTVADLCAGAVVTVGGTPGDDELEGTPGDDVIRGFGGDDVLRGLGGNDLICGDDGEDLLLGGPGDDTLFGGDGKDNLRGAAGDDALFGGAGSDRLLPDLGNDALDGGPGSDLVDYRQADGPVTIDLAAGFGNYSPLGAAPHTITLEAVEKANGSFEFPDLLIGDDRRNVLRGYGGADELRGQGGDDDLIGGTEDDFLLGGDGDDLVKGQANDDSLMGEAGADRLVGGNGSDTLWGGSGDDTLIGGLKRHLGTFVNTLDGGDGTDVCRWETSTTNCP